jgi:hypothetical protein
MNRKQLFLWAVVSAIALAQPTDGTKSSQPRRSGFQPGGPVTSVLSGKTVGTGQVLSLQLGFPGLSVALLTAMSDRLDFGARFSALYSYEGITGMSGRPGVKLQGVMRLGLLDRGRFSLGLKAEPGVFLYSFPGQAEFGIALPLGINAGFQVLPSLMLSAGLDVPMFAVFGPFGGLAAPILIGGGLEYAFDRQLGLSLNLRGGPSVPLTGYSYVNTWNWAWCSSGGQVYRCGYYAGVPALEAQIGLTYRL